MLEYTNSALREVFFASGGVVSHHELPASLTKRIKAGCARLGNGIFSVLSLRDNLPTVMADAPPFDVLAYEYAVNTVHLHREVEANLFPISYSFARAFARSIADTIDASLDVILTYSANDEFGPQAMFTFYQNGPDPLIDVTRIEEFCAATAVFRIGQKQGLLN